MVKHTETPLELIFGHIQDAKGNVLFHQSVMFEGEGNVSRTAEEVSKTAKFIVKAYNHHERLVDDLKRLLVFAKSCSNNLGVEPNDEYLIKDCEQAIQQAESEE